MLQCLPSCLAIAPSASRAAPAGGAASDRRKGGDRERNRLRNPAHARSRAAGGPAERDRQALARADQEERRQMGRPPAMGAAPSRLRDRPQARGHLSPAHVRGRAGDARRDLARAQDHGRRHAPQGGAPREGPVDRSARAGARRARSGGGSRESGFGTGTERLRGEGEMANINRVVLVGNLTKDPELRHTPSGTAVCSLRLAVNSRRKDGATGEWTEKPNYFDITVWGNQGESCAQYLSKGRPVAVDGRLEWREWDAQDGSKRQAVEIIADSVQFLGSRGDSEGGGQPQFGPPGAAAPTENADFG